MVFVTTLSSQCGDFGELASESAKRFVKPGGFSECPGTLGGCHHARMEDRSLPILCRLCGESGWGPSKGLARVVWCGCRTNTRGCSGGLRRARWASEDARWGSEDSLGGYTHWWRTEALRCTVCRVVNPKVRCVRWWLPMNARRCSRVMPTDSGDILRCLTNRSISWWSGVWPDRWTSEEVKCRRFSLGRAACRTSWRIKTVLALAARSKLLVTL